MVLQDEKVQGRYARARIRHFGGKTVTDADRHAASVVAAILARAAGDRHVTANEIIQALRGHGWRPPTAHQPSAWQPPPGARPLRGDQVHAIAAKARAAITNPLNHLDPDGGLD